MHFSHFHRTQVQALTAGAIILATTFFSPTMAAPQRRDLEEASTGIGSVTVVTVPVIPTWAPSSSSLLSFIPFSSSVPISSSIAKEHSSSALPSSSRSHYAVQTASASPSPAALASQQTSLPIIIPNLPDIFSIPSIFTIPQSVVMTLTIDKLPAKVADNTAAAIVPSASASASASSTDGASPSDTPTKAKKMACSSGSTRKCCRSVHKVVNALLGVLDGLFPGLKDSTLEEFAMGITCTEMTDDSPDSVCEHNVTCCSGNISIGSGVMNADICRA